MLFSNLVYLKGLLMVLTAVVGTVAGGTMLSSYVNGGKAGPSFLLTVNPSILSIEQDSSFTSSVSIISVIGFSGTVSLSLFFTGSKLPATISPTSVSVPANGTAKSTLTVTATSNIGNYNIVVIGIASSLGKTTYASADLSVQVVSNQDFTITSSPSNIVNVFGSSNTTTAAPFGYITVTGSQNMLTLSSDGTASSTLNITTSLSTTLGNYNITVTGTDGSRTHSMVISLTVVDPIIPPPVIESLKLNGYQFINGTSLSLVVRNAGNTSVTTQSYTVQDSSGNTWTLSNLAGPTIIPNDVSTMSILIGANCPGCVYGGIPGLFLQFNVGQSYTVILTTTRGNQFSFTVTR
ncbi:hypothetical protein E6H11_00215 [Candidatus Bathyarchaeota archaeon]|nr:MAG: hypothetical protein E6H11_00215 [Candidatus Bathyarchaeota archaeon]